MIKIQNKQIQIPIIQGCMGVINEYMKMEDNL